jgi:hypothetical protein
VTTPAYNTLGLTVPVTDLLDPVLWRERYAFGITLGTGDRPVETDSVARLLGCSSSRGLPKTLTGKQAKEAEAALADGVTTMSDDVITWFLRAAVSELEMRLGLPLGLVVAKGTPIAPGLVRGTDYDVEVPLKPFLNTDQARFYRIDLPAGTIQIDRIRAFWFGQLVWSISAADGNRDLIVFEHPNTASLHLMPTQSATLLVAMPALGSAAYGSLQLIMGYPSPLPGVWSVDYVMGPTNRYGGPGDIEAVLAHWVYARAGVLLLSIGGRAASRGLQSASLSIDGLSKSVGLAGAGAINKALEDRLQAVTDSIKWQDLKLYKAGLRVRPYGA